MTAVSPPQTETAARVKGGDTIPRCGVIAATTGLPCGAPAGTGTDHIGYGQCFRHGGRAATNTVAAREAKANDILVGLGRPRTVDPLQALLDLVYEAAGNVAFLRTKVQEAQEQIFSSDLEERIAAGQILRMYNDERDRLASNSKLCVSLGLAERVVKISERQMDAVVLMAKAMVRSLNLTPDQERVALKAAAEVARKMDSIGVGDDSGRSDKVLLLRAGVAS